MKKGWIERGVNTIAWNNYQDNSVQEELDILGDSLGFEIERVGDRLYLIPTQDNDLFLKNNIDYRSDIKADKDVRIRDLYLMNYMAVYMLYIFFKGEGSDIQVREFVIKKEFINIFTEHCKQVDTSTIEEETNIDYSEVFKMLSESWLCKKEGEQSSTKMADKYGMLNKLIIKFRKDDLFFEQNDQIKPTRKLKDLMPYFLRKDRVMELQAWLEKGKEDASDNEM